MQTTIKLTVRLPTKLHAQLKQRAHRNDQSLNTVVVEALQECLAHPVESPLSEHEKYLKVLRDSGMLVEMGSQWFQGLEDVPLLTHEELQEKLHGCPPLSEIMITDRGPR